MNPKQENLCHQNSNYTLYVISLDIFSQNTFHHNKIFLEDLFLILLKKTQDVKTISWNIAITC